MRGALNEPRQTLPITVLRHLRAERLVVLAHDLMQRALLGATRAIAERRRHAGHQRKADADPASRGRERGSQFLRTVVD